MLTFTKFSGINNVQPAARLRGSDLVVATDVNIGLTGELSRRGGFTEVSAICHKNLHQGDGFMLATVGNELASIWPDGTRHTIHATLGSSRVRYCNLPDGRTLFSNGLIHGATDGVTGRAWSIPAPPTAAVSVDSSGEGVFRFHLTYVDQTSGAEGPMASSTPHPGGGASIRLDGLPQMSGYDTRVYLSGPNGEGAFFAGTATPDDSYESDSAEPLSVVPCRTQGMVPTPVGSFAAPWRGRVLVAQDDVLWATAPGSIHLCRWRDFKQFGGKTITAIQTVDDGIYVGLEDDLVFLPGKEFNALSYISTGMGGVVPGSGVTAPGDQIKAGDDRNDDAGRGTAMLCIAGGSIVAGFNGGAVSRLTGGRYRTDATEVAATWRELDGVPQYIAVPQ